MKSRTLITMVMCAVLLGACKEKKEEATGSSTPVISYKVKTTWPHDTEAFTEGLVIHKGVLYEGTGQEGKSWIGTVDIATGKPDKKIILDNAYFGEGITILNNKIYQLTYTTKIGFVYDLKTFKKIGEFTYESQGWGITHDGTNLIMSDGSHKLTYLDTVTLKSVRTVEVTENNLAATNINELEYVEGYIYANQWQTNNIVKIDAKTGNIVARMDLTSLAQNAALRNSQADVLNGIAYHEGTKLFVVTGKNWPSYYVIQLTN